MLLLTPTAKDAALTASVLEEAGMECVSCSSVAQVRREVERGVGVVLLPEEAVLPERDAPLVEWLGDQPAWSDLPVLVLARPGADSAAVAQAMDLLGNVTVLERPMRVAALVSAVRTALRARQRRIRSGSTSLSTSVPSERYAIPTGGRTSSWPSSRMSCAIRSRRFATPCRSSV